MILDDIVAASRAKRVEVDYFAYSAQFPIAAFVGGAVVPINLPINNDSDFLIRYSAIASYSAVGVPVVNPDYLVTIFDTGSGRNLQDQALHVQTCMGSALLPYIFPEPKFVKAGSVLAVTLINRTPLAADVWITLSGFKVYYLANYNRQNFDNPHLNG